MDADLETLIIEVKLKKNSTILNFCLVQNSVYSNLKFYLKFDAIFIFLHCVTVLSHLAAVTFGSCQGIILRLVNMEHYTIAQNYSANLHLYKIW